MKAPRSATHGYPCFKLPAFNELDEAIVQGRLEKRCVYSLKCDFWRDTFSCKLVVKLLAPKVVRTFFLWGVYMCDIIFIIEKKSKMAIEVALH